MLPLNRKPAVCYCPAYSKLLTPITLGVLSLGNIQLSRVLSLGKGRVNNEVLTQAGLRQRQLKHMTLHYPCKLLTLDGVSQLLKVAPIVCTYRRARSTYTHHHHHHHYSSIILRAQDQPYTLHQYHYAIASYNIQTSHITVQVNQAYAQLRGCGRPCSDVGIAACS